MDVSGTVDCIISSLKLLHIEILLPGFGFYSYYLNTILGIFRPVFFLSSLPSSLHLILVVGKKHLSRFICKIDYFWDSLDTFVMLMVVETLI